MVVDIHHLPGTLQDLARGCQRGPGVARMGFHHGRHHLPITTAMESMIVIETETDHHLGAGELLQQEETTWTHTSQLTNESEWTAMNRIVGVGHAVVRRLEVEYMTEVGKEIADRIAVEVHLRASITNHDGTARSVTHIMAQTTPITVVVEEILQGFQRSPVILTTRFGLPGAVLQETFDRTTIRSVAIMSRHKTRIFGDCYPWPP